MSKTDEEEQHSSQRHDDAENPFDGAGMANI